MLIFRSVDLFYKDSKLSGHSGYKKPDRGIMFGLGLVLGFGLG